MTEQQRPGAYYGANVRGAERAARGGDDRPSGSHRKVESTMNVPGARQIPIEGAVTGPDAAPVRLDELYGEADLDQLNQGPR